MKQFNSNTKLTAEYLPDNLLRYLQKDGFGTIGMLQLLSRREVARIVNLSPASSECAIITDRCLRLFSNSLRLRNDRENYVRRAKEVFPNPADISMSYMFLQGIINRQALEMALESSRYQPQPLSTYGEVAMWRAQDLAGLLTFSGKPYFDHKTLKAMAVELKQYGLAFK